MTKPTVCMSCSQVVRCGCPDAEWVSASWAEAKGEAYRIMCERFDLMSDLLIRAGRRTMGDCGPVATLETDLARLIAAEARLSLDACRLTPAPAPGNMTGRRNA